MSDYRQLSPEALYERHRHLVPQTRVRVCPGVPQAIAVEDLEQEGHIGLWKAAVRFDGRPGVQFPSYAITCIRGALLEYLRREDWAPRSVRARERELKAVAGAHPEWEQYSDAERAGLLGLSLEAFYTLVGQAQVQSVVSIEEILFDDGADDKPIPFAAALTSPDPGPEQRLLQGVTAAQVRQAVGWLPAAERLVIERHYLEGRTLTEISAERGMSGAWPFKVRDQALPRLREFLTSHLDLQPSEPLTLTGDPL
jgi:RNA polymerase sigma factor for flagellar operon FliA